jgi:hypothetical protein
LFEEVEMQIEMTGKEDRLSPWKYAVGGFPGSGKTLLASTAPKPLFVFFRENPRIKSIADRHIPHVKVLNDETATVIEKMQALAVHLELTELSQPLDKRQYETLVIDTGDELFNAMKEARREKNGGEWGPGDWAWLGDAYRAMMETFIDLDMRLIVTFHIKTSQEGDDVVFRELMLQGVAKDEAPGWFDVVGALDTYEVSDEEGELTTTRVLLTHSSRLYPWVKDHSGNMPRRWELTSDFVGDVTQIEETLNSTEIQSERAVLDEFDGDESDPSGGAAEVVTPEELETHKSPDTPEINAALDAVVEVLEVTEISDPSPEAPEEAKVVVPDSEPEKEPEKEEPKPVEENQTSLVDHLSSEQTEKGVDPEEEESPLEAQPQSPTPSAETPEKDEPVTTETIKEPDPQVCEVCGEEAPEDVITVSKIRFKKVLCRDHFREELSAE